MAGASVTSGITGVSVMGIGWLDAHAGSWDATSKATTAVQGEAPHLKGSLRSRCDLTRFPDSHHSSNLRAPPSQRQLDLVRITPTMTCGGGAQRRRRQVDREVRHSYAPKCRRGMSDTMTFCWASGTPA